MGTAACSYGSARAQHSDTGLDAASAHAVLASSGVWRAIVGLTTSRNVLLAPRQRRAAKTRWANPDVRDRTPRRAAR